MIKRDGYNRSLWQKNVSNYTVSNKADKKRLYDAIIVGGGITGLTTGLVLQRAGFSCLLIEAENLCFGTTGGSTAHINTLLDTPYSKIAGNFGKENASLVAQAAKEAVFLIRQNINDYSIDCDFEESDAYLFSQDEKQSKELEGIQEASARAGIDIHYTEQVPLPIEFEKALRATGQAKFHPVRYVHGLAKAFEQHGGVIIQQCRATGVKENEIVILETSRGNFKGKRIIYATHIPPGVNLIHLRCQPFRSYAMAVQLKNKTYPQGLCYDMYDPYHYYRSQVINNQPFFIVGGYDHKTGKENNTEKLFLELEAYIRKHFSISKVSAKWSSQYFEPADGLPYIGNLPGHSDLLYVASGFGGNGITYSHVSALVLKSILMNEQSPYISIFDPNRIKPVAGFKNFISQNVEAVKNFLGKMFSPEKIQELADLAPGEGKVVEYEDQKLALYKNENGNIFAVNPTCTHLKCTIAWNGTEQSWDCPCHGARFSVDGQVLTGPADHDLERIIVEGLVHQ